MEKSNAGKCYKWYWLAGLTIGPGGTDATQRMLIKSGLELLIFPVLQRFIPAIRAPGFLYRTLLCLWNV
jgi:hypothetical protein